LLISTKMKKDLNEVIEIPQGINANISDATIILKGKGKEIKRIFPQSPKIKMELKDGKIVISSQKATKRELKLTNSLVAHIKNMIDGISEDFVYKLEVCNVHFPVTVRLDGKQLKIKNFLGEKIERSADLLDNVKVNIKGNNIEVSSPDIEAAGQTAARIEIATKIRNRDRRVFQDGIFIIEKPGRRVVTL
jgi:large subunit ribosomal protein L6